MKQLRQELDNLLFFENWQPSVVLIDYIDIMKFQSSDQQYVAIDDLYAEMRGLALERNICVITATQANREGANSATVDRQHVGGSISKLHHLTSCISITNTKQEMANGIFRLSQVVEREGSCIADQVIALSCLGISQIFYDSRFLEEVQYTIAKDEKDENTKPLQKV
jgi:replicative DNA helicase